MTVVTSKTYSHQWLFAAALLCLSGLSRWILGLVVRTPKWSVYRKRRKHAAVTVQDAHINFVDENQWLRYGPIGYSLQPHKYDQPHFVKAQGLSGENILGYPALDSRLRNSTIHLFPFGMVWMLLTIQRIFWHWHLKHISFNISLMFWKHRLVWCNAFWQNQQD